MLGAVTPFHFLVAAAGGGVTGGGELSSVKVLDEKDANSIGNMNN